MNALELKKSLHEKIDLVDDVDLLNALNIIISRNEPVYQIPEKWLEDISRAEKDLEEGKFYTLTDFEEKHKKWLKD